MDWEELGWGGDKSWHSSVMWEAKDSHPTVETEGRGNISQLGLGNGEAQGGYPQG